MTPVSSSPSKSSRYLEFSDGSSNKFWRIELDGSSHTVTFGRIGTNGQTQTKDFASDEAARKAYDKLVAEKTKKGYVDAAGAKASTASVAKTADSSSSKVKDARHKSSTRGSSTEQSKGATEPKAKTKTGKAATYGNKTMRPPAGFPGFCPWRHSCPPFLGFTEFRIDVYGGGDYLAFYWPMGAEGKQPLVVRVYHETLELVPFFSSYRPYQKWCKWKWSKASKAESDESDEWDESEDLPDVEDTTFDKEAPEYLFSQGRQLLKDRKPRAAVSSLNAALDRLPEFKVAWSTLAKAYRELGKTEKAIEAALRAVISPPTFGRFEPSLLGWLGKQKTAPQPFADNPIWTNRRKLKWTYKNYKPQNDYGVIRESIDAFCESGHLLFAIMLMESFNAHIYWENESIQRKWKYDQDEWMHATDELCRKQYGSSRIFAGSD